MPSLGAAAAATGRPTGRPQAQAPPGRGQAECKWAVSAGAWRPGSQAAAGPGPGWAQTPSRCCQRPSSDLTRTPRRVTGTVTDSGGTQLEAGPGPVGGGRRRGGRSRGFNLKLPAPAVPVGPGPGTVGPGPGPGFKFTGRSPESLSPVRPGCRRGPVTVTWTRDS